MINRKITKYLSVSAICLLLIAFITCSTSFSLFSGNTNNWHVTINNVNGVDNYSKTGTNMIISTNIFASNQISFDLVNDGSYEAILKSNTVNIINDDIKEYLEYDISELDSLSYTILGNEVRTIIMNVYFNEKTPNEIIEKYMNKPVSLEISFDYEQNI